MSNLRFKGITDDATQEPKCSDDQLSAMLEIFTQTVLATSTIHAYKASFEANNFAEASQYGLADYRLTIERTNKGDAQEWIGNFERNGRRKVRIVGEFQKN